MGGVCTITAIGVKAREREAPSVRLWPVSPATVRSLVRIATLLTLLYSAAHFAWSGVRLPFDHPNLGKFDEEAYPLREHLATGAPVHSRNPAQYGPAFFFVMHPLLARQPSPPALAYWLYAIQIVCLVASFVLTCAVLKPMAARADRVSWPLVVAWLAVIWLNFSPLYTVMALKSVETWELLLITLGLYAHARGWRWTAALALAAGGLIKVLPFAFLYYWLVTNRRTFAYACVAVAGFLALGQYLYGGEMGLWYLPRVAGVASGSSYGLDWHENISLKAAIAKLFGELPQPTQDAARTSGYFIALAGWRKTMAVGLGDALVAAIVIALTWLWWRVDSRSRSRDRMLWEWSVLTIAILVLSPNTVFEYLAIGLGAVSYVLVRLLVSAQRHVVTWCLFIISLLLTGGIVPRQWLNWLTMIETLQRWTGLTHLTPSEAYQYYCFPLLGLLLLLVAMWRLAPQKMPTSMNHHQSCG
jgi:hypothetical protein